MDKRCVDIDDVLDLFGIEDEDIYAKGTIEDALYDGTLKVYKLPSAQPIDVQEAYYRGKTDGVKECTARLKKVNEEVANG